MRLCFLSSSLMVVTALGVSAGVCACSPSAASLVDDLSDEQRDVLAFGPESISLSQAVQKFGTSSSIVMSADLDALKDKRILAPLMEAVPKSQKEWLISITNDLGFDPIMALKWVHFWSDAKNSDDIGEPGSNTTFMLASDTPITAEAFKAFSEAIEDDDEEGEGDDHDTTAVMTIYSPISDEDLNEFAKLAKEDKTCSSTQLDTGNVVILCRSKSGGAHVWTFVWSDGVAFGTGNEDVSGYSMKAQLGKLLKHVRLLHRAEKGGNDSRDFTGAVRARVPVKDEYLADCSIAFENGIFGESIKATLSVDASALDNGGKGLGVMSYAWKALKYVKRGEMLDELNLKGKTRDIAEYLIGISNFRPEGSDIVIEFKDSLSDFRRELASWRE